MQSKLEVQTTRVNEVEKRVRDIEHKLVARKEAEEKREKQVKDHEESVRKINDSLIRKNIHIIGVLESTNRDRGPESIFE